MTRMFALTLTLALTPAAVALVACDGDPSAANAESDRPSADEVVARHLEAIGGEARWRAIDTLEMHGSVVVNGTSNEFHAYRARPGKFRKEGVSDGKPYTKVYDGARGFKRIGDGDFEPIPAEHAAKLAAHADFDDALIDYAHRGTSVELVGVEEIAGAPAYHLALTLPSGDVEHRWFDGATYLDVKRMTTYKDKDGQEKSAVSTFSEWREVGGLKINFAAETEHDGKRSVLSLDEVVFDRPLAPSIFTASPRVSAGAS